MMDVLEGSSWALFSQFSCMDWRCSWDWRRKELVPLRGGCYKKTEPDSRVFIHCRSHAASVHGCCLLEPALTLGHTRGLWPENQHHVNLDLQASVIMSQISLFLFIYHNINSIQYFVIATQA